MLVVNALHGRYLKRFIRKGRHNSRMPGARGK